MTEQERRAQEERDDMEDRAATAEAERDAALATATRLLDTLLVQQRETDTLRRRLTVEQGEVAALRAVIKEQTEARRETQGALDVPWALAADLSATRNFVEDLSLQLEIQRPCFRLCDKGMQRAILARLSNCPSARGLPLCVLLSVLDLDPSSLGPVLRTLHIVGTVLSREEVREVLWSPGLKYASGQEFLPYRPGTDSDNYGANVPYSADECLRKDGAP